MEYPTAVWASVLEGVVMKDGGDLVKEDFEFCSTCELDMSRTEELE